jgi:hypothetical protein
MRLERSAAESLGIQAAGRNRDDNRNAKRLRAFEKSFPHRHCGTPAGQGVAPMAGRQPILKNAGHVPPPPRKDDSMHEKNKITEHDRERLDGELNAVHLAALQVELKDLDDTSRQHKALAAAVDSMSGHVAHLRHKWHAGADDGPVIQYKPKYETREEARP